MVHLTEQAVYRSWAAQDRHQKAQRYQFEAATQGRKTQGSEALCCYQAAWDLSVVMCVSPAVQDQWVLEAQCISKLAKVRARHQAGQC
jgi:hypothetical protein